MAKILNTDDILEIIANEKILGGEEVINDVVEALDNAAQLLANHYGIDKGNTTWEGKAFAGLCVSFYAKDTKQECPAHIHEGDDGGDWETKDGQPAVDPEND